MQYCYIRLNSDVDSLQKKNGKPNIYGSLSSNSSISLSIPLMFKSSVEHIRCLYGNKYTKVLTQMFKVQQVVFSQKHTHIYSQLFKQCLQHECHNYLSFATLSNSKSTLNKYHSALLLHNIQRSYNTHSARFCENYLLCMHLKLWSRTLTGLTVLSSLHKVLKFMNCVR